MDNFCFSNISHHFVGSANFQNFQFLGHDMDVSDYDGRTPLHLAAAEVKYRISILDGKDEQLPHQGHKECVTFLLYKCNVNPEPTDR